MINLFWGDDFLKKIETDKLLGSLRLAHNIDQYFKDNGDALIDTNLSKALCKLAAEKELSKPEIFRLAEINEIYGYQIFAGKRIPSRDKLICLGFGMKLSSNEMQDLLKLAGMAPLYPKNVRDSIILFGFLHQQTLMAVNEALFEKKQVILG